MKTVAFYSYNCYAGKDTAADFFAESVAELGYTTARTAFADIMKIVAADALGIKGTDEEKIAAIDALKHDGGFVQARYPQASGLDKVEHHSGRDFIIGLAGGSDQTYGLRRWDQDVWIRLCLKNAPTDTDFLLVTDMRFQPEADAVHERRGIVIDIAGRGEHKNEDKITDVDYVVFNTGDLDHLRGSINAIVEEVTAAYRM